MRIIHIISGLSVGGAERMLCSLIKASNKAKFEIGVVCLTKNAPLKTEIEEAGAWVKVLNFGDSTFASFKSYLKLVSILRRQKPDVTQTWLYHADFIGLIAHFMCSRKKIFWNLRCSTIDSQDVSLSTFFLIKILARLSKHVDGILVNSFAGKLAHEKIGYQSENWLVIPNGVNVEQFNSGQRVRNDFQINSATDDKFVVGIIGRWHPMKDHQNFISAAKAIQQNLPNAIFVLAGENLTSENICLVDMIKRAGLSKCAFLLGHCKNPHEIMLKFDVLVSSSYSEGFPSVIAEAMACQIPCVTTDVGDARIIVGTTGKIVPPRDSGALAQAVLDLHTLGKEKRYKLGIKARRRIIKNYSITTIAKKYERLYSQF